MDKSEIIIYTTEDGLNQVDVTFDGDTVWLSLDQMAELFQRDKSTISRHIKKIFEEGELMRESTVAKFATVQTEGNRQVERTIDFYNLDAIISVGYRVKSQRGVQFRIWASSVLKEYLKKVSHSNAIEKAREEYRKYQEETLSPVEVAYLETIKETGKKAKTEARKSEK